MKRLIFVTVFFLPMFLGADDWDNEDRFFDDEVRQEEYDPIERVNRGVFWFNDQLDTYILEPTAKGYRIITPTVVERSITNFFANIRYPQYLVCDLVGLEFTEALKDTGRFVINTTVGLLGLFDVAAEMGMPERKKDFGLTLGAYDLPAGPYFVMPFIGPSNVRDTVGFAVDMVLNPFYWVGYWNLHRDTELAISAGTTAIKVVNQRGQMIDTIAAAKESSFDYYLFARAAYSQFREGKIREVKGERRPVDEPQGLQENVEDDEHEGSKQ